MLAPKRVISGVIAASGLCAALAACGPIATTAPTSGPIVASAPTTPAPTAAPEATSIANSLPTASARPTQTAVSAAAAAGQGTTTSAAAADPIRLVVDSSSSQASYHAREQLVGKTLPSGAVGTSKSVSGALVLGADGSVLTDQSKITVDLTKLQSDESRRDNFIKMDTLQTSRFPMATFVPNAVEG